MSDVNEAIKIWIHKEYGKQAGLLRDEYNIIFDSSLLNDIHIQAGAVIQIGIKYAPWDSMELCRKCLARVFANPYLPSFRRGKGIVTLRDATQWYSSSFNGVLTDTNKIRHKKFETILTTRVTIRDTKTGATQTVEINNSDGFTALNKATRMLYGSE